MEFRQLTEHHLGFLSFKRGCTGSSESTLVKRPHCWKSHVAAHIVSDVCTGAIASGTTSVHASWSVESDWTTQSQECYMSFSGQSFQQYEAYIVLHMSSTIKDYMVCLYGASCNGGALWGLELLSLKEKP